MTVQTTAMPGHRDTSESRPRGAGRTSRRRFARAWLPGVTRRGVSRLELAAGYRLMALHETRRGRHELAAAYHRCSEEIRATCRDADPADAGPVAREDPA